MLDTNTMRAIGKPLQTYKEVKYLDILDFNYKVYIKIDDYNNIIAINSSAFISDPSEWIQIDEGVGDKYHHAQGNYFEKSIMNDKGIYRYKYVENKVIEKTDEEMEEKYIPPKPIKTDSERITAIEQQLVAYENAYRDGVQSI